MLIFASRLVYKYFFILKNNCRNEIRSLNRHAVSEYSTTEPCFHLIVRVDIFLIAILLKYNVYLHILFAFNSKSNKYYKQYYKFYTF